MTDPNHIAEARKKVSRPQIREAFLRNGAKIEPERDDLPDYVYESVFELLDSVIQQAGPAIQYAAPQPTPDVAGLVEALDRIANLPMNSCSTENDYRLSAAKAIALATVSDYRDDAHPVGQIPGPVYQQPAPDVGVLVEALERIKLADGEARHHSPHGSAYWNNAVTACIEAVLVAHRKQGGEA